MLRAYKYRLYPTKEQAVLIDKHIGCNRFVYNLALETKNLAYATNRTNLSCFELMRQLTDLKNECEWLREVDSQSLQQSIINLDKAFTSFFKGKTKFPKFKSKSRSSNAFRNPHGKSVSIKGNKICFPKFTEGVRVVQDRQPKGEIRNTTVSKTPTGKYFISVLCETGKDNPKPKAIKVETSIGVDLGLNHFIITSDGVKVDNPRHLKKALSHLKYAQRRVSKKQKGSNNKKKAVQKLALVHEKVANQRKDFLHKLSSKLVSENGTLCFEDLNINGMVKNHNLAQSISSAGWGMFVEMCKYKSEWYGKNFVQLPRFEPSTKLCSNCGATNHTLTLKDREWICASCQTVHDRDVNAALNIKNYGIRNSGGRHRKKSVELPTMVGAMKQKDV